MVRKWHGGHTCETGGKRDNLQTLLKRTPGQRPRGSQVSIMRLPSEIYTAQKDPTPAFGWPETKEATSDSPSLKQVSSYSTSCDSITISKLKN